MIAALTRRAVLCVALFFAMHPAFGDELFTDIAESSGIDFVHFNGMSGEYYFPEMMGAGVALFDYDNDGDLDIYLVQGHMLGGKPLDEATFRPASALPFTDRLYRNDSSSDGGEAGLRFTDVTEEAGIDAPGYGMGVAVGDIDNDGWADLYVTNYLNNQMWRNNGDGTFSDVTAEAGTDDPRWSVSASFLDYDKDGLLDLYVGNYIKHSYENRRTCRLSNKLVDYCGPLVGSGYKDSLFRNLGDGRFEDVSDETGITKAWGGALGVVSADFDGDSWPDIYVANDGIGNLLWINDGSGGFSNTALLAGVSVNKDGRAEASMGLDAADFDGDGDEDLFMTHLTGETNTLYINDGQGWFDDESIKTGIASDSFPYTGFGAVWIDIDNDGDLDLVAVNGAVAKIDRQVAAGDPFPLRQANQVFLNDNGDGYVEITDGAGGVFELLEVSRGLAAGDIDNDGDVDLLISNNAGPARLLQNQTGSKASWFGLQLVDESGRPTSGARVAWLRDDEVPVWRRSHTDGSYASASDPRLIFGAGPDDGPYNIIVAWPGGDVEAWKDLEQGRYHSIRKGTGRTTELPTPHRQVDL